jgi:hypothetical protein
MASFGLFFWKYLGWMVLPIHMSVGIEPSRISSDECAVALLGQIVNRILECHWTLSLRDELIARTVYGL